MIYWGGTSGTQLHISDDSYRPAHATAEIAKIMVLPSTDYTPVAVLQQMGHDRRQIAFKVRSTDGWSHYQTLSADWLAGTARRLVAPPTSSSGINCVVLELGQPLYRKYGSRALCEFDVVLAEEDT